MGELNQHHLSQFNCNVFIETGTGQGTGLDYACGFPFQKLHTIEIIPELQEYSKKRITDYRVTFHLGHSADVLDTLLPTINKTDRILFWVDAHFPGVDFGLGIKKYVFDDENMPLEKELKVIKKNREGCFDTLIIDDLRFYEDAIYELGNIDIGKPKSGIGFIETIFGKSHDFLRDYRHQGFIILTPKI
jgi:hypothetical protein